MSVKRQTYYSCTASTGYGGLDFQFNASFVRVYMESSGPLYLTFGNTCGTTGGYAMASCDSPQTFTDGITSVLGFASTTTAIQFRTVALGLGG
jgi:hypothetical protein